MKNIILKVLEISISTASKLIKERAEPGDLPQCESVSSSASEFNCCVREAGHKGLHRSADGHTWY